MTTTPEFAAEPDEAGTVDELTIAGPLDDLIAEVEEAIEPLEAAVDMAVLDHPHRLLLVHAHPDDEVISTGGVMAMYSEQNALVTLITCTLGEEGEVVVPALQHLASDRDDTLGTYRIGELAASCEALGVKDHRFLGGVGRWRDSGMMGEPTNDRVDCFWKADLSEAAHDLVKIMREVRPQVVITYDENGAYGHPDHIMANKVTVAAFDLSADPSYAPELGEPWQPAKLYYSAIPRTGFREAMQALKEQGVDPGFGDDEPSFIIDDELVTTHIDVQQYMAAKVAAMRAHATQIAMDAAFYAMADGGPRAMFAHETFRLVRGELGASNSEGKEDDLFAGLPE
jgi:N-acetyl-1-D-myo-inositol-2-amino-2-deoxy-alpha-D-glucopyranoside deacetylase